MDWIIELLERLLPVLKLIASKTTTMIDDLIVQVIEAIVGNADLREQFKAWLESLKASAALGGLPRGEAASWLEADAATVSLCQRVGVLARVDWKKILEMVIKYLPLIIGLLADKPTDQSTEPVQGP